MMGLLVTVSLLLLGSAVCNLALLSADTRRQRLVALLQQKLRVRDERARIVRKASSDITSDWVLVRAEGHVPLASSPAMQTWLLQPRRMLVLTNHEDVWVSVTRHNKRIDVRGQVRGARVAAWGYTYTQACDCFIRAAYHVQTTWERRFA